MLSFEITCLKLRKILSLVPALLLVFSWNVMGQDGQPQGDITLASLGLPSPTFPTGQPPRSEEAQLGKELFHETALSMNHSVSCATCHLPEKGFAEPLPISKGIFSRVGIRNAPTLLNVAFMDTLNWDGAHRTLEEQAIAALTGPREMGLALNEISPKVEARYGARLKQLYGAVSPVTI